MNELLLVIGLSALATISPGADFAIVTQNSLRFCKTSGYMTALGVACATWIHTFYCITGLAIVIAKSPMIFNSIKYFGASYLLYLGIKSFFSKAKANKEAIQTEKNSNSFVALRQGFLSNATNPKTTLFYLSLFSMVISPSTPLYIQVFYGFIIFLLHLLWFSFVCYLINHPLVSKKLDKLEVWLTKTIGIFLLFISAKIFFELLK